MTDNERRKYEKELKDWEQKAEQEAFSKGWTNYEPEWVKSDWTRTEKYREWLK